MDSVSKRNERSNPLLRAAEPLLVMVGEARLANQAPDLTTLHRQLAAALRVFGGRAGGSGVVAQRIETASQVLRLFIDESLAGAVWSARRTGDDTGGERSFADAEFADSKFADPDFSVDNFFSFLVEQVNADDRDHELLEFLYVLLILGLEGGLLAANTRSEDVDHLIAGLGQTVERGPISGELLLSPHWQSPLGPHETRLGRLPRWVALVFAGVLLLASLHGFRYLANDLTEPVKIEFEFVARPLFE